MKPANPEATSRRKAVWGPRRSLATLLLVVLGVSPGLSAAPKEGDGDRASDHGKSVKRRASKLDAELGRRKDKNPLQTTSVIVRLKPGVKLPAQFAHYARRNELRIINGQVLELPNRLIRQLENHPAVDLMDFNRPIEAANERTATTVGSRAVQKGFGLTGAGVGVAVIDSGIASWHDDLTNRTARQYPFGNQRVSAFVDFVNGRTLPYDDEGHGSHVSGIILGNGSASGGRHAGIAPDASLVSLKVLDANGAGTISNIIAALDWVLANRTAHNIRVVNMSVGASVQESYWTDPLTVAAKRVVDAGVVVVSTSGNRGMNAQGQPQYGGITAPGNAPWVLTVGGSSTNGTGHRGDDTIARFSSRGPSAVDYGAKPDLVAPGHGTASLADPLSASYISKAQYLVGGTTSTGFRPYVTMSGTSMAAPVVAGTVALMIQANPALTPNAVKAILQYTAQEYPGYDALTEGAGFLNALGALRLAKFFATARTGDPYPSQAIWSKKIIWGNQQLSGGLIAPGANAWEVGTTWGVARQSDGDNIVWGTLADDNIVWGTSGTDDNIVWGTDDVDNIVWGTDCGGADCDNIVWGTVALDNMVWGTTDGDDNIVWGTNTPLDNIVWGTSGDDNIVWGTSGDDNIVWGTSGDDNIVWGTSGDDNIVWGTVTDGNISWGSAGTSAITLLDWRSLLRWLSDQQVFNLLAAPPKVTQPAIAAPILTVTQPPLTGGL